MKKTFPLTGPGKADQRVVESIKHDVRKYVKRERGKPVPEGFDLWEFNCKVGATAAVAASKPLKEVGSAIDDVAKAGGTEVFIEILAAPAHRIPNSPSPAPAPSAPL